MRSKERLTITLSRDLLEQVDGLIDKETIRNRSHAIETLIRKSLKAKVTHAVILAGGGRQTDAIPALTRVDGQRLIHITLNHIASFGIRSFIILAGSHQPEFQATAGNGEELGVNIRYIAEGEPLGTAGALKAAEKYLVDGPFLVVNGDVLTTINITDFIDFFDREQTLASIAVKPRSAERHFGQVMLQGNRITDFYEQGNNQGVQVVNTGVYLMSPKVLSMIEGGRPAGLETSIFPRLAQMGELSAFFFQGVWFDISTAKDQRLAQLRWSEERSR